VASGRAKEQLGTIRVKGQTLVEKGRGELTEVIATGKEAAAKKAQELQEKLEAARAKA